jgi:hypothetical protein
MPLWRAGEGAVGKFNIPAAQGQILESPRWPGRGWSAANSAAERIRPSSAEVRGHTPSWRADGTPPTADTVYRGDRLVQRSPADKPKVEPSPLYRYVGRQARALLFGKLIARNQKVASCSWPSEPGLEPCNRAARDVMQYYEAHRGEVLPALAWDEEAGRLIEAA